ncbi:hypothetical protein RHGRI_036887 [Rhododendron griersonianum]|uniref:Uncharacterized protein n=1 Tax=Rhododendron griersonianum TaxID=479676 RepID=A0AAV6HSZ0_9ERIC|nr:hypothetical protein RHGRI_036887 [Rhododendron griersonianum]
MDTNNPLWSYVTKLEKLGDKGGNTLWQCNFCSVVKNVTKEVLATMKKLDEEAKARMKENAPKKVPLPPSTRSSGFVLEGYETKKQRTKKAFDRGKRDQLHAEIARMFYSGGVPFNLARNPYYVSSLSICGKQSFVWIFATGI